MSTEYLFYPALKREGKYIPLLFDMEGEPACVFWRSRSFIDGDFFTDFPMVSESDFGAGFKELFVGRYEQFLNSPTHVYKISESALFANSGSGGIKSGYAPHEDIAEFYSLDEDRQEYLRFCMTVLPAEAYAELPRKEQEKYGRFAEIDYSSRGFVCSHLATILNGLELPWGTEGEKCYLMELSF